MSALDRPDLSGAQVYQGLFDALHWKHKPGFETFRHTYWHLGILVGEMAKALLGERVTKPLTKKVIGDLLSHALRLANNADLDATEVYEERMQALNWRFGPSEFASSPFGKNPKGCICEQRHRSDPNCPSRAKSRRARRIG